MKFSLKTLLIYFSAVLTAATAAISSLTNFWVGWFLLVSALITTGIAAIGEGQANKQWAYQWEKWDKHHQLTSQYIGELEESLEEQSSQLWELTEAAIDFDKSLCHYCNSKHSLLSFYPFDPNFHLRDCPVPFMRSQVAEIKLCDPAKIEEYSQSQGSSNG